MSLVLSAESAMEAVVERVSGWAATPSRSTGLVDCCLIIPTYRRPCEVVRLLQALAECEQETPGSVPDEVIVVDGSADLATQQAILSSPVDHFPFTLKYFRSTPGLTRQRNVGIDACSREFVFFLDDDTLPAPGYFLAVRRVFAEDTTTSIGAVGAYVVNECDLPLIRRWRFRFLLGIVPRIEPMRYAHCGTSNPRSMLKPFTGIRDVDLFPGCAFSVRCQVFRDERFSNFFEGYSQGEDVEMSLRVGRRWKVVCAGDAKVIHHEARAGRPPSFAKGRMDVRNRVFIWRRYSAKRATALDKLRLLADFGFLVLLDLSKYLSRPWNPSALLHGAGIICALVDCVFRPPDFDEATHRIRYQIDWRRRPACGAAR